MMAKLIVDGKEFDIEILDPKLQEIIAPKKKTGYEPVGKNEYYWIVNEESKLIYVQERSDDEDTLFYSTANYYESEFVAAQNARADTLMRQLRRFAVERRKNALDWENFNRVKWCIAYGCGTNELCLSESGLVKRHGVIYFDDPEDAKAAIETFRNELIWYFTEYKDSL